jgi:hypothetical protein
LNFAQALPANQRGISYNFGALTFFIFRLQSADRGPQYLYFDLIRDSQLNRIILNPNYRAVHSTRRDYLIAVL